MPSSDKAGRSVPAPGKGALSVAREVPSKHPMPILDVAYRSRQLAFRRNQISQWLSHEHSQLKEEIEFRKNQGEALDDDYFSSRVADIEKEASRQDKDALASYGMLEGADPRISPLRRALAVWGLTADDIGVLSIHGTSTGANVSFSTYFCHMFVDRLYRRKMRPRSGTIFSLQFHGRLVMLFLSWLRRASSVTQRVVLRRGKPLVCCRRFSLVSFQATGIASECTP
jgi:hypothetical protein